MAFELATYSKIYARELRAPTPPNQITNPDGLLISRAVKTLHTMALKVFTDAVSTYPLHTLKLVRNMLVTMKTGLVRLLQSWQLLTICRRCIPQEQWLIGVRFYIILYHIIMCTNLE
jgi:hypothetical protein